jgi:16S rRNA (cytosine967-C5)-methyltransferase
MDLVFVDAPCTGSGVWRRQPDAKWRLRAGQVERRQEEQDEALAAAAEFVKPGGRLVYVTCSLFVEENEDRVAAFLEGRPAYERRSAAEGLAASGQATETGLALLKSLEAADGSLRLTPRTAGTDGFFVAVMARKA